MPPHKQDRELTPTAERIEMLELAIAGNLAFSVCRYETDRGGVNYTVDTLAHLRDDIEVQFQRQDFAAGQAPAG